MQFDFQNWSRGATFVTTMGALYPVSLTLITSAIPSAKSTPFCAFLWAFTFAIYFFAIRNYCRSLRSQFGLLKAETPRRALTKKEYVEWKIGSILALAGRGAAVFLGCSNRSSQPWKAVTLQDVPAWSDFLRIHAFILVLDLLFYCMHRTMHSNRFLYKLVHAKHHELHLPTPVAATHDSYFEKFFNSFLQVYLTSFVVPLSFYHLHFTCYAIFYSEILGHSGLKHEMTPPYTPILDFLNCSITIESHDLHHRTVFKNFGKQTVVWDKLFGTFLPSIETAPGMKHEPIHHHHHH